VLQNSAIKATISRLIIDIVLLFILCPSNNDVTFKITIRCVINYY